MRSKIVVIFQINIMWFSSTAAVVQLLCHVWLFVTPWAVARQASLSFTLSQSLLNSCPLSQRCHPAISSSVVPFSSCFQSFPASGPFLMNKANRASLLEELFLTSISYKVAVKKWSEDDQTSNHLMERICKLSN